MPASNVAGDAVRHLVLATARRMSSRAGDGDPDGRAPELLEAARHLSVTAALGFTDRRAYLKRPQARDLPLAARRTPHIARDEQLGLSSNAWVR